MKTPRLKQVMMFSATLPEEIRVTARKFMTEVCGLARLTVLCARDPCSTACALDAQPMEVKVDKASELRLHGLKQFYVRLKPEEKNRKLADLLDALEFNQVVIFVSTDRRAEDVCRLLQEVSFPAGAVHGSIKDQAEW